MYNLTINMFIIDITLPGLFSQTLDAMLKPFYKERGAGKDQVKGIAIEIITLTKRRLIWHVVMIVVKRCRQWILVVVAFYMKGLYAYHVAKFNANRAKVTQ